MALVTADGNTSDAEEGDSVQSSIVVPAQVPNVSGQMMWLFLSTSHPTLGETATWSTPAGWTQHDYGTQGDLRTGAYYRQSTGTDDAFPNVTLSKDSEWSTVSIVVDDVDWTTGPIGASSINAVGTLPDLTTTQDKSVILYVQAEEDNVSTIFTRGGPNQKLLGFWNQNATAEGVSNHTRAGWEFVPYNATTANGPTLGSNGDRRSFSIEILTQGNFSPITAVSLASTPVTPTNTGTQNNWIADLIATNNTNLRGDTCTAHSFDAATDVDPTTDEITITGHGMKTTTIVRAEANGNTLPTGITDGNYYWVKYIDANTVELWATPTFAGVNPDADALIDLFCNNTTIYPTTVNITADGSGTCILREIRMLNSYSLNDIFRPNAGSAANADGSGWVGDCGWLENDLAYAYTFTTPQDWSSVICAFTFTLSLQSVIQEYLVTMLDSDGDWITWKVWDRTIEGISKTAYVQIEPGSSVVQAQAIREVGTFNAASVEYVIFHFLPNSGYSSATGRPGIVWDVTGFGLVSPFTVFGGTSSNPISLFDIADLLQTLNDPVADTPSDLQIVLRQSVSIGTGTDDIVLAASEKSVAFPPLADGVTLLTTYRESLGIFVNLTADSEISIRNTQMGATAPFVFEVDAPASATLDLSGNTYVEGNVVLDVDFSYSRQLFVGGNGVTHNDAEITGSTFIVGAALGANNGMVAWGASTNISDSEFQLGPGVTTGHAIIITTAGTYTFTGLTFTGFGADGTDTAAVYNNSGGAVTINIAGGGSTPTVRNGASATTSVVASVSVAVKVVTTDGTPIENARVFLKTTPGGVVIFDGSDGTSLTDSSGDVITLFSGATPVNIVGRARLSSTSPFYKTGIISGEIFSSGFSATIVMILDE